MSLFAESIPAILVLADGRFFHGCSLGAPGQVVAELVFNTSMTGYQEIMTDPSYAQQIVAFTYPHIGNVGINDEDNESNAVHAAAFVVADSEPFTSNWRATDSLQGFCHSRGIVLLGGIDTRALTHHLRQHGAQAACIITGSDDVDAALALAQAAPSLQGMDLTGAVTTDKAYAWEAPSGSWHAAANKTPELSDLHVVVMDFGVKQQMLRLLVDRGCKVTVVPANTSVDAIMQYQPSGILLSNGPGDPAAADTALATVRELIQKNIPIFGICLGFQLMALAAGGRTEKMTFGHHGANHPVFDEQTNTVLITSQNHGFMVTEGSLPAAWQVTHRSLFDGSIQALRHSEAPLLGFQGHPEASPGPQECNAIFDVFVALMREHTPFTAAATS